MSEQVLRKRILELSDSQEWERAKREWYLLEIYKQDEDGKCLCGHNPIKEILAWLKTREVNRFPNGRIPILYKDWESFDSSLINQNRKVSVVIPTLNRYDYLKDVLKDLEAQDYSNFEVIVAI